MNMGERTEEYQELRAAVIQYAFKNAWAAYFLYGMPDGDILHRRQ